MLCLENLEASGCFNAGRGSSLTREGTVEMEAAVCSVDATGEVYYYYYLKFIRRNGTSVALLLVYFVNVFLNTLTDAYHWFLSVLNTKFNIINENKVNLDGIRGGRRVLTARVACASGASTGGQQERAGLRVCGYGSC